MRIVALMVLLATAAGCQPDGVDVLTPIDTVVRVDAAGVDLAPSLCSLANAQLCESFEGGVLNRTPWDPVERAASLAIDSLRAFRGLQSLRLRTDANPSPTIMDGVLQAEVTQAVAAPNPRFMRFFIYLPSPRPLPNDFRVAAVLEASPPYDGVSLFVHNGAFEYGGLTSATPSTRQLATDRWVCVEWMVRLDAAGETQLWVDDQEVTELHVFENTVPSTSTPGNPMTRSSFGLAFFGDALTHPEYRMWIDEIIVDSRRIGCDR